MLSVEAARKLTANESGRCIGRKPFRELVRQGVIPSWRNPLSGHLYIPESAMQEWLVSAANHEPKPSLDEWRRTKGAA